MTAMSQSSPASQSPEGPSDPRLHILKKTRDVISFYLEGRDRWNPARGLKAAVAQAVSEYENRFLIELVLELELTRSG